MIIGQDLVDAMRRAILAALLLAACAHDRPIHPLRLEGFPGAPVAGPLFPLVPGRRWVFEERVGEARKLELSLVEADGELVLQGRKEGRIVLRENQGYLDLLYRGQLLERPLKLEGRVGDSWKAAGVWYTIFGYEELEILGRPVRALVVAAERHPVRDYYWFAAEFGWVRFRTERSGKVRRDATLVAFEPGQN